MAFRASAVSAPGPVGPDPAGRDDPDRRTDEAGLIAIAFAMNGAALLPGIKRAMGFATACDPAVLRRWAGR